VFFFIGSAGRVLEVPDGNWQYLSLEPTRTPSHYKNRSGKFLKGVGKLLSRSFLTKNASPVLLSAFHSRFFFAGRRRKEKSIKKKRR